MISLLEKAPFLLLCGLFVSLGAQAGAVPPLARKGAKEGIRTCFVNPLATSQQRIASSPLTTRFARLPHFRVVVLRVQFADLAFRPSADPAVFFEKVRGYYSENSDGAFQPQFTLSPVFSLPFSHSFYGANCGDDVSCQVPRLISDSLAAANASINFSSYDQVMIFHSGYGEESTGSPSDIWSLFLPATEMPAKIISVDGQNFDGAMIVPELESGADALGVICHEYGHQLGLPDLYDTSGLLGNSSTLGSWDLMDYPWTGSPLGANPPHLGAWSKKMLGFGSVTSVSSGTVFLNPMEGLSSTSLEIYRSGSDYFLLEYRSTSLGTYDQFLPQPAGLLVWHVDTSLAEGNALALDHNTINVLSLNGHLGVDLVEADGRAANPGIGDLGINDAFVDGQSLAAPRTNLFTGAVSSLVLTDIEGVGQSTVTAQIVFLGAGHTQSVARALSYPNPATGQARAGAPTGTWATLRIQLSRPVQPSLLNASLYTILGERVRNFSGDQFVWRQDLSRDSQWVYESDWDGKDEGGTSVASGVYPLEFEIEGTRIRKTVVVQRTNN